MLFLLLFEILLAVYVLFWRPEMASWGATLDELRKTFPGDELAPESNQNSTRALTIHAPPEAVWLWVAQIGQERGGFYSYQWLENLMGCKITNADNIVPEWELRVGDSVRLGAQENLPAYSVVQVEREYALVLQGINPKTGKSDPITWQFILEETADEHTRLLVRSRITYNFGLGNFILWRIFTEPGHFVMERAMLQGIKRRVERQPQQATARV